MSNVYRTDGNVTPATWPGVSGAARAATLSGIAAAVSLGVPFGRIAQAAPSASYMVAQMRDADEGTVERNNERMLKVYQGASLPGDFWRIAGPHSAAQARVGSGHRGVQRRAHDEPRRVKRKTSVRRKHSAARHVRYGSNGGAMAAQFYDVKCAPVASPLQVGDWANGAPRMMAAAMGEFERVSANVIVGPRAGAVSEPIVGDDTRVSSVTTWARIDESVFNRELKGDVRATDADHHADRLPVADGPDAIAVVKPIGTSADRIVSDASLDVAPDDLAAEQPEPVERTMPVTDADNAVEAIVEPESAMPTDDGGTKAFAVTEGSALAGADSSGQAIETSANDAALSATPIAGNGDASQVAEATPVVAANDTALVSEPLVAAEADAIAEQSAPTETIAAVEPTPEMATSAEPTATNEPARAMETSAAAETAFAAAAVTQPSATTSSTDETAATNAPAASPLAAPAEATAKPDSTAPSTTQPKDGAKITSIAFSGNAIFSADVLREQMGLSATDWKSWYTNDNVYTRDRLAEGLERIRQYYLDRGYLEFRNESANANSTPDGKRVSLAIVLHEGPQYTLSSIRLDGAPPKLQDELEAQIENQPGKPLAIGALLRTRFAILGQLGEHGYANAIVTPSLNPDQQRRTIDVVLRIDAGARVAVRRVDITGNTVTRDEVVRREIEQVDGDWYDAKKIAQSRKRLNDLGYFSNVDIRTVPVGDTPGALDVKVNVVEKTGAPVTVGVGYSSAERFVASAGITYNNVLGIGTNLGARFGIGKSFRTFSVSQTNPYFTESGVQRTTRAYYRSNEPLYYSGDSRFKMEMAGLDTRFTIPLGNADKLHVGAAFEHHRLTPGGNTPPVYADYIARYGRESANVPVMLGWTHDRLDHAAFAENGYWTHASIEYGTPVAGNQYYKADVDARWSRAFTPGVVLRARVQGGYGSGVGNHPYPIFKNYFAGGIDSVRGYEPGGLSPRDARTNQPVGGSKMLVGTVEIKAPLRALSRDSRLSALAFVDGGNVWGSHGPTVGSNGMRFSYGTGLSWDSPIGSFQVSLGLPIKRHESDRYQKIQIQFKAAI